MIGGLRYFQEVARCGSIRQAALNLHVAASAISRQITRLEHEFGLPLFERRPQGMRLTAAGELLARHAQNSAREFERVRAAIDDLQGLRRGEVTLYVVEGVVAQFLPAFLAGFHERYPGLDYHVYVAGTHKVIEALLADEADIGIAFNAPAHPDLRTISRLTQSLEAIVSPRHPLAARPELSLAELSGYAIALPDRSFGIRQLVDAATAASEVSLARKFTTNSIEMTKALARQGAVVAFLPAFAVLREKALGELVSIPIDNPHLNGARMELIVHAARPLSKAATELVDGLAQAMDALTHREAAIAAG